MSKLESRLTAKISLLAAFLLGISAVSSAQTLNINEYVIPTPVALVTGIAKGPDGALWFTERSSGANGVGKITTAGVITEYQVPTSDCEPSFITAGPDGALWFTEFFCNKIGRITTAGVITEFQIPTQNSYPDGITAGPDGALWFTEFNGNKIGRITTAGVITEYLIPTLGSAPEGITAGPDGSLWFTEYSGNKIGQISMSGEIAEYPVPTQGSALEGIAPGPDGALWFTESIGNKIGRITTSGVITEYTIPTQGSYPEGLTTGQDGAIWFTEYHGNKIGRITMAGAISEHPIPTVGGLPEGITTGPDGALWFTETGGNKIGRGVIIPQLTVTATCPMPAGIQARAYSFAITTSGGFSPLSWALTAGSLPPGLTLNPQTGVIAGTPTAPGSYPFTVTVTDSAYPVPQTATYTCTLVIVPLLTITAPCPAPAGVLGSAYSFQITTSGGVAPLTWTLTAGALPPGLTLNQANGLISGIPTTTGSYPFSVTVTDSSQQSAVYTCSIVITSSLTITTVCPFPSEPTGGSLPPVQLTATGGNGTYRFSVIGSLPPNLQLIGSYIAGPITAAPGTYPFTLQVTSGQDTAQKPCGITITPASPPPLQITSGCPSSPIPQGVPFYENLTAAGGSGTYTWSIIGNLPNGLTLSGAIISGTPTGPPGTSNFIIQVSSGDDVVTQSCSLTISAPTLQLTSGCPGNGTQGAPYGPFNLTATGGLGPGSYSFSIKGVLPPGVTLSGSTISGTPTAPGEYLFSVSVTSGTQTVTGPSCPVTIAAGPQLQITGSCPGGSSFTGVLVSLSVSVTGGKEPYTYTLSGPSWLTLSSKGASATASGTPGPGDAGSFPIVITVTDAYQSTASFRCTITIVSPPTLQLGGSCPANPFVPGAPVSVPLTATGGVPPYNWTLGGDSGLSLNSSTGPSNSVTGYAPANYGNYSFTVGLSDSGTSTPVSLKCSINVPRPQLQISGTCPASNLDLPVKLSVTLMAAGGQPPYSWTLMAPTWLSLNPSEGTTTVVSTSGTPDNFGPFSFTATLTDSASSATRFSCNSSINKPPIPTVSFTGLTPPGTPFQPVTVGIQLSSGAPLPLTGVAQLTFVSNAFGVTDNPQVYFDGGQRTVTFTLAAGQTTVSLPNIQQGTDAGTIHVEVIDLKIGDNGVLPTPHPFADLVIPRTAPVITDVTFANETAGGFDVVISGYSTPRDMKSVTLTFAAAPGAALNGNLSFSEDVSAVFAQYYSSAASQLVGSMFQNLHVPVTVTGDKAAIGSVSVTLSNSVGNSATVTKAR